MVRAMFIGSHAGSGSGRNTRYNSSGCGRSVGERHFESLLCSQEEFTTVAIVMLWFVMFRSGQQWVYVCMGRMESLLSRRPGRLHSISLGGTAGRDRPAVRPSSAPRPGCMYVCMAGAIAAALPVLDVASYWQAHILPRSRIFLGLMFVCIFVCNVPCCMDVIACMNISL